MYYRFSIEIHHYYILSLQTISLLTQTNSFTPLNYPSTTLISPLPTFSPASLTPLPSSSMWNLRFSSRITEPTSGDAHAFSTSAPQQSDKNVTLLCRMKENTSTRGCLVTGGYGHFTPSNNSNV